MWGAKGSKISATRGIKEDPGGLAAGDGRMWTCREGCRQLVAGEGKPSREKGKGEGPRGLEMQEQTQGKLGGSLHLEGAV